MLEEAARLRASLIGEKKIAEQRLNSIRSSVSGLQSDSDTLNTAQIQLRALQREADATREVFEAFLSRYKETAQLDYDRAQARVLSLASIPTAPQFPKTRLNYAIAGVLGCVAGALNILLLDLPARDVRSASCPDRVCPSASIAVVAAS